MELGKLLCIRGQAELKQGAVDAARRALDEAESLAAATGAGPDSALRRAINQLRAVLPMPPMSLSAKALRDADQAR
jgi:hypothetical protein